MVDSDYLDDTTIEDDCTEYGTAVLAADTFWRGVDDFLSPPTVLADEYAA